MTEGEDVTRQPGQTPEDSAAQPGMTPMGLQEGQVLAGRYRIEQLLGSGGMGEVWKAWDTELDIPVALKVLPPILARNRASVEALKREATLSLQLSHTGLCRLYNFHADGDTKFLVMEYIQGKTLEDLLDDREERRLPLDQVLPIAEQIAEAMDAAHSTTPPVTHRDIKPSNIMVTDDGRAKLLDFGIARQLKDSMTRVTGKETSGTLLYMAPEQYAGQDPTPASDVYSLAATVYECLCGHPPFYQGAIGHQLLHMEPNPLSNVPEHVNRALQAGLTKDPAARPVSGKELVARLKSADAAPPAAPGLPETSPRAAAQTMIDPRSTAEKSVRDNWGSPPAQGAPAQHPSTSQPDVPATTGSTGPALDFRKLAIVAIVLVVAIAGIVFAVTRSGGDGDDADHPAGVGNVGDTSADPEAFMKQKRSEARDARKSARDAYAYARGVQALPYKESDQGRDAEYEGNVAMTEGDRRMANQDYRGAAEKYDQATGHYEQARGHYQAAVRRKKLDEAKSKEELDDLMDDLRREPWYR